MTDTQPYIHPSSFVDEGASIGPGTKVWHFAHIMSGASIGTDSVLGQNVFVADRVVIGDRVKVQNNVSVYEGVVLEDDVFCGPSMVFTNVTRPRAFVSRRDEFESTLVKKGATLGANCTVMCGVTIGRYAMVGAGAVVLKDVADHELVVGAPARRVGWACVCSEQVQLEGNDGGCGGCDRTYRLVNGLLKQEGEEGRGSR